MIAASPNACASTPTAASAVYMLFEGRMTICSPVIARVMADSCQRCGSKLRANFDAGADLVHVRAAHQAAGRLVRGDRIDDDRAEVSAGLVDDLKLHPRRHLVGRADVDRGVLHSL